jgi:chordin
MLHLTILLLLGPGLGVEARRRKELPIDREPGEAGVQQRAKASECRFGGETYELEQTWHPDLGPPFNVMYCVHCECVPIHKKRRIVGRVRCKNIKTECPKPTCPEPLLLPGRCCKVCPGQHDNPDLTITVDLEREEQERNGRHYAAVLTGPGVEKAATARFYFRKKTLQYSFLFGEQLGWPSLLTFLDDTDDIIEGWSNKIYNQGSVHIYKILKTDHQRSVHIYKILAKLKELSFKTLFSEFGLVQTPLQV